MKSRLHITLLACSLSLVALQFVVYAPALDNAFVRYDDDAYVYANNNIKTLNAETVARMFARPYFKSYTPVTLLSHAVDYALWGTNPWGHHLTGLILHSVNVVLIFVLGAIILSKWKSKQSGAEEGGLLSRITPDALVGAFVAALLYSLHPVRVESVAWVADHKDLLLALFLTSCILAYLKYDAARGTRPAVVWFIVAMVCNLAALLSKTMAVVAPLLLLTLDGLLLHRGATLATWRNLVLEKIPFFLLSVGCGLIAMSATGGDRMSDIVMHMTPMQSMLTPLYIFTSYLVRYLVPIHLSPIYEIPPTEWMALGALATLLLVAGSLWAAWKGRVGWLLGLAGYMITISPTLRGLSAGMQLWADRYTYLPSIALFLLLGGAASLLWERRIAIVRGTVIGVVIILTVASGIMSRQQLAIWKNSETLWRAAVSSAPNSPLTYVNLGVALAEKGDLEGAFQMYRAAARIKPKYPDALFDMGVAFEAKGMPDSALQYYAQAILADTEYVDAYVNLGNLYANQGNRKVAILLYHRALALDGTNADAYYNLGSVQFLEGDLEGALRSFREAITLSPSYAKAYYNMGVALVSLNRENSAVESFIRAARLGSPEAQRVLSSRGYSWK